MNRRDRELLDRQLHGLTVASQRDGILVLAFLAVFFAGITLGSFLYAYTSEPPMQLAANDAVPAMSLPHQAPHIGTWQ